MYLFLLVLLLLFFVALKQDNESCFSKAKMIPFRAFLAIFIVADHLTFYIDDLWAKPFREWGAPIVSIFMFISGYGLVESFKAKGKTYLDGFFGKRIWKVILPGIIALSFFYICTLNRQHSLVAELREFIINGMTVLPFSWYVEAIVLLYMIFYCAFRFLPSKYRIHGLLAGALLLSVVYKCFGYDRCWYVCNLGFAAGGYYSWYNGKIKDLFYSSRLSFATSFVCVMGAIGLFYILKSEYSFLICYIFIPLAVVMVISKLNIDRLDGPVLSFIGSISYEIYLCQGIAMEILRPYLSNSVLFAVAVYCLVFLLAWFVNRVTKLMQQ